MDKLNMLIELVDKMGGRGVRAVEVDGIKIEFFDRPAMPRVPPDKAEPPSPEDLDFAHLEGGQ